MATARRRPRFCARATEPAFMDGRHPIFCAWAELRPGLPRGRRSWVGRLLRNNCLIHSLSHIVSGDRAGAPDSCTRDRRASAPGALVAKYGCDTNSELALQVWRRLIIEEIGGGPSGWNAIFWSGRDSNGAEAAGSGWRCARLLHIRPNRPIRPFLDRWAQRNSWNPEYPGRRNGSTGRN